MKEKTKKFFKENKVLIIWATVTVVSGALIAAAIIKGKVRWSDQYSTYTKEGVMKFLQEVTNPNVKYAIFKEAAEDVFQIVML